MVCRADSPAERWGYLAVVDGVLAATALEHDLTLVTRILRDFAVPGVVLLTPWDAA